MTVRRRKGSVSRYKSDKVKTGLKSGAGAGTRTGRQPLGGSPVNVSPARKRKNRSQRKPAQPKMRVGRRG